MLDGKGEVKLFRHSDSGHYVVGAVGMNPQGLLSLEHAYQVIQPQVA
jgi:hypothetical protein